MHVSPVAPAAAHSACTAPVSLPIKVLCSSERSDAVAGRQVGEHPDIIAPLKLAARRHNCNCLSTFTTVESVRECLLLAAFPLRKVMASAPPASAEGLVLLPSANIKASRASHSPTACGPCLLGLCCLPSTLYRRLLGILLALYRIKIFLGAGWEAQSLGRVGRGPLRAWRAPARAARQHVFD